MSSADFLLPVTLISISLAMAFPFLPRRSQLFDLEQLDQLGVFA
jgi:hypothetical protein